MKKKLAGLLIFSQAIESVSSIDKTNYRLSLCDANLFKATSSVPAGSVASATDKAMVAYGYQEYCSTRGLYDMAVEDRAKNGYFRTTSCHGSAKPDNWITGDACIQKTGIALAQTCEKLKQYKSSKQAAWNEVVPTLESCNNARRR